MRPFFDACVNVFLVFVDAKIGDKKVITERNVSQKGLTTMFISKYENKLVYGPSCSPGRMFAI